MNIFSRNSPAEDRLSRIILQSIIEEAAASNIDLIFTYVWNFSKDKGKHNIDAYKHAYEAHGGEVRFVELIAPADIRAERSTNSERYKQKSQAPTKDEIIKEEGTSKFVSRNPFFYPDSYKQIDTSNLTAEETAQTILD